MSRRSLERALATRMSPTARAWQRLADQVLATLGISNSAGWALVHLERLDDGARQGELARAIGITEPSLVRTLHQLERAGLVTRRADEGDRRANLLHLTDEGKATAQRIDTRLADLRSELLIEIPAEEIEAAVRVIDRVAARIAERLGRP